MLMKLLKTIVKNGAYSNTKISNELGIEVQLIDKMFHDLIRLGYIEYENDECEGACNCSCSKSACCCSSKKTNKLWRLTDKGKLCIERV